jgi:Beta-lactamase enzyme family
VSAGRLRRLSAVVFLGAIVATAHGGGLVSGAEGDPPAGGDQARASGGGAPWHPHVKAAKRYARSRAGQVSFAITRLNGELRSFHPGRSSRTASLYKAMLLAAYLNRIRNQQIESWERNLLRPMIRVSDNDAATTIDEILGRRPIERLARRADMNHFRWNDAWGLSRTSAADQARFFRYFRRRVPERHERFAMRQLASIVGWQRWGIAEVRPKGWQLYFKGGWGSGIGLVDHQSALLERGRMRVGLSILTEGNPSHGYGNATLRGVAKRLLRGLHRVR